MSRFYIEIIFKTSTKGREKKIVIRGKETATSTPEECVLCLSEEGMRLASLVGLGQSVARGMLACPRFDRCSTFGLFSYRVNLWVRLPTCQCSAVLIDI